MKERYTNQLVNQSSPYLLQHASNPVDWYPWGEEALLKAQNENKLILISIGYAACHWCHVMAHESFESEEIAQVMNDNFVCIKVDREERPDIDHIYMNAVQLIAGNGGWPLNCFALPDGSPVYGGTYFRPEQWKNILENLSFAFKTNPEKFNAAAKDIKNGLQSMELIVKVKHRPNFTHDEIELVIEKLKFQFDNENGGTKGAPKFPIPVNYYPLMRYYFHFGGDEIRDYLKHSLHKMANGGIYDHLGGGFARYSVDNKWLVPHFEKMLYDNAQLISLFSDAYRFTKEDKFQNIVAETINFVIREMRSPALGFYSSYDADSEGIEGKYYVWDKYEVDILLEDKSIIFCTYYDVTIDGNWEGTNILNVKHSINQLAKKYNKSSNEINSILDVSKQILFEQREKRIKPALDDKILASWNSLVIKAFIDAYKAFNNKEYLQFAIETFEFVNKKMLSDDYKLYRSYKDSKAIISGFLDDYALLIQALISLYQVTFDSKYIILAKKLSDYTIEHFYDHESGMFNYKSNLDKHLVVKPKEIIDNVIPSSNSIMANNLFILGHYFSKQKLIEMSQQMLVNVKDKILKSPYFMANWFDLLIQQVFQPYEVCLMGTESLCANIKINESFLPNVILAGGTSEDIPLLKSRNTDEKLLIYLCKNQQCLAPIKSINEALVQIKS